MFRKHFLTASFIRFARKLHGEISCVHQDSKIYLQVQGFYFHAELERCEQEAHGQICQVSARFPPELHFKNCIKGLQASPKSLLLDNGYFIYFFNFFIKNQVKLRIKLLEMQSMHCAQFLFCALQK